MMLGMADDKEIANLLRKHGGKTGEELKAEGTEIIDIGSKGIKDLLQSHLTPHE